MYDPLQKAFETIKNASEHMTIWIQDADDKEKCYEIKPDSVLGWYKIDNRQKQWQKR